MVDRVGAAPEVIGRQCEHADDAANPIVRPSKLTKEIPRLCRGGSKCLTFPAVAPQAPIDETSSGSRQAHK